MERLLMSENDSFSAKTDKDIQKYWNENNIPKKVREKKAPKNYYFIDGPPYASGSIHLGTAMNRILKDFIIRYKRMTGYNVLDTPGFDTHGVPIEMKVQKKFELKSKKDIEEFGIEKFVEECKKTATEHISDMSRDIYDLGQWMDWENPYKTLNNNFLKTGWWVFKKATEKGLLYYGKYPVHVCPTCETAVSFNEIEHIDLIDTSIYVCMESCDEENKYYVIWTTTPWTLPANMAIMVNPSYMYIEIIDNVNNKKYVVAQELVEKLVIEFNLENYSLGKKYSGKELEGKKYKPILGEWLNISDDYKTKSYKIVLSARYVHLEEGTGLVHCAPGHGREDYEIGKANNIPAYCPVTIEGTYDETVINFTGKKVKELDDFIIKYLEEKEVLLSKKKITHSYPTCWRCHTPLLQVALPQWFLNIEKIKDRLIEINKNEVEWYPSWAKDRFHDWLNTISDWPISRSRYWGITMPIWKCENCNNYKVFGSLEELKEKIPNIDLNIDLHRPYIDKYTYKCENCGGVTKRIPDIFDVWFDSGIASWASINYPENSDKFNEFWPPDINIEGSDQIRGWWNSQLITSVICFDKAPYKKIALHGMVLAVDKRKLSKSEGNDRPLNERFNELSRDYYRYYFAKIYNGMDIVLDESKFKDIKRIFNLLENIFNLLKFNDNEVEFKEKLNEEELINLDIDDKWILSKFNNLLDQINKSYNGIVYSKVILDFEKFILEEFSRIYIKLIKKKENKNQILNYIFSNLLLIISPITPHFCEYMYLKFNNKKETIHLKEISQANLQLIDIELENNFQLSQDIIQSSLYLRENLKKRLRWVLPKLIIVGDNLEKLNIFKNIIKNQGNFKEVIFKTSEPKGNFESSVVNDKIKIFIDKDITDILQEEWEISELTRLIQATRKKNKLVPSEIINIDISCNDNEFINKYKEDIEKTTSSRINIIEFKENNNTNILITRKINFTL
jgi:isoleucyl-tRNA synthetase